MNVKEMLEPLFCKAQKEKKWFRCNYQGFILSPRELRLRNNRGELLWGPVNWELVEPPVLRVFETEAVELKREIEKYNDSISNRILGGWDF